MARIRQAGMVFILITMFLDVLGLGIIIPVLPQLVIDFRGGDASEASRIFGWLIASFAAMQFLFAPVLGALSDRVGRRPVISGIGMVFYGLAAEPWMMLAVIAFATLGAIGGPAIQGIVAGAVPSREQGAVQGALTSLVALTAVFAPLLSTELFARFSGDEAWMELPGAPFFAAALLMAAAVAIVVAAFRRHPTHE